MTEKRLDRIIG